MPLLTRAGETITVADGTVPYWLARGWQLDLNGDGVPDGTGGAPGRGITSTAIIGGRLVVTYSDQTTQDAGPVPGSIAYDGDGVPYVTGA